MELPTGQSGDALLTQYTYFPSTDSLLAGQTARDVTQDMTPEMETEYVRSYMAELQAGMRNASPEDRIEFEAALVNANPQA